MTDYIQAWQCIGCGKIEAPQPCIGVCQDRKVLFVGKSEHDALQARNEQLHQQLQEARQLLAQLAHTRPREGQWQRCWLSIQEQANTLLVADAPIDES